MSQVLTVLALGRPQFDTLIWTVWWWFIGLPAADPCQCQ